MKKINFNQYYLSFPALLFLIVIFFISGCWHRLTHDNWQQTKLESFKIEFNQTLLRECIPYISKQSGINIKLSKELNEVNNLYVDFAPVQGKTYSVKEVLFAIKKYIVKEHSIEIDIIPINDSCILLQLKK